MSDYGAAQGQSKSVPSSANAQKANGLGSCWVNGNHGQRLIADTPTRQEHNPELGIDNLMAYRTGIIIFLAHCNFSGGLWCSQEAEQDLSHG